jgi:tetratricopeptide (TPR) repeat protein
MLFRDLPLTLTFWLLAAILIGYLPISLFLYWFTKVRGGQGSLAGLIRDRDIAGFFGERPTQHWNDWAYVWSMLFATLVITVGFLLAYPATLGFLVSANLVQNTLLSSVAANLETVTRPLFFGFLGAYLFTIQTSLRRFMTTDLTPDTYFQVATRTILAVLVAAVFSLAFPVQADAEILGIDRNAIIYTLAFVVGIFPENGLNWILSFARRYMPNDIEDIDLSFPLTRLSGLNRWHAIRLNVEGIDNVHNLANSDVTDLVRRTKFSVQQLFDWIDQAVLLIHLSSYEEFKAVQALGIRGLSDFQTVFLNTDTRLALENILGSNHNPDSETQINGQQRLQVLYATLQQAPSADPIRLFWRYKSSYLTGAFEFFNRARVFAELGEHARAIEQCDLALERNPLDPILMITRGESRRALAQEVQLTGDHKQAEQLFQQAISDFTKAVELDPFSVDALFNRGETYLLTENYAQAQSDFDAVLQAVKEHIPALNMRARAFQAQNRYAESIKDLKRALKLDETNSETYVNLANAYRLMGSYDKAENTFDQASRIDPNLPAIYHGRGLLYATMLPQPRYEAAYQNFNRAIELNTKNPALVYKDWGEAYYRQGDFLNAIVTFELAIEANKSYALAYNLRGLAYHAAGQPQLAINDFTTIIEEINREYADAYVNRGIALSDLGNYQEALVDLNRGIDMDPDLVVAYTNRGSVYRKQKDYQLALADFKTAIRIQERELEAAPQSYHPSPVPYNNLGDLNLEMRRYQEAIDNFDKAISIDPRYPEAYNNRGLARRALRQYAKAADDLAEAIKLDPLSAVYPSNRGLIYLDLGSFPEAIRDFSQAIQRNAKYVEAYLNRAIAYDRSGDFEQALTDLEKILTLSPNHQEALDLLEQVQAHAIEPPEPEPVPPQA